jgi:hypothetical protein
MGGKVVSYLRVSGGGGQNPAGLRRAAAVTKPPGTAQRCIGSTKHKKTS